VVTHGPYANAQAYELIAGIDPDVVWFPALWPETYSYTLSLALHLGLPVVVPDIGAFCERVAGRPCSVVMPWDTPVADWADFWRALVAGDALAAALTSAETPPGPTFYESDYLAAVPARTGELAPDRVAGLAGNLDFGTPTLSRSERLLGRIWRLSRQPLVAKVVAMVPFRLQQAIKRRLSARPMHDIVR